MNKQNTITFVPSHYAQCIDRYEVDLTNACSVNCCYCSLKNTKHQNVVSEPEFPLDFREKGIYLSPDCDPFASNARAKAHEVLARFLPQGVPFLIITKCQIPSGTIELLAKYAPQVYVQVSISRLDDTLNTYIEPGAASAQERLQTIRDLVSAGIRVTPVMMPLLPGVDDDYNKLSVLVQACADAGAKYLKASYVIINHNNTKQMKKMHGNAWTNWSLQYLNDEVNIHIGSGRTVNQYGRKQLYRTLTSMCSLCGMQFQACPILDPTVLDMDVKLCATYRKKNGRKVN